MIKNNVSVKHLQENIHFGVAIQKYINIVIVLRIIINHECYSVNIAV